MTLKQERIVHSKTDIFGRIFLSLVVLTLIFVPLIYFLTKTPTLIFIAICCTITLYVVVIGVLLVAYILCTVFIKWGYWFITGKSLPFFSICMSIPQKIHYAFKWVFGDWRAHGKKK